MNQISDRDSQLLYRSSLETIASIRRKNYPEQGRIKQMYAEVTDCLRNYLNRQYGLDMKDRSLEELERVLRRLRGPSALFRELRDLFSEHEKVQAVQWLPGWREARQLPDRAQSLLHRLAPPTVREEQIREANHPSERSEMRERTGTKWVMSSTPASKRAA